MSYDIAGKTCSRFLTADVPKSGFSSQLTYMNITQLIHVSSMFLSGSTGMFLHFSRMKQRCHRKADGPFGLIAFLEFGSLKRGGLREVGWSYPMCKRNELLRS